MLSYAPPTPNERKLWQRLVGRRSRASDQKGWGGQTSKAPDEIAGVGGGGLPKSTAHSPSIHVSMYLLPCDGFKQ